MNSKDLRRPYAILTISFAAAVVCLVVFLAFSSKSGRNLQLSSGQPGGVYLPLAEAIRTAVGDGEQGIEVIESAGSGENARRLQSGEADLALIQNDTVAVDGIRTLVPLHKDVLHFLVRDDSGILGPGDIEEKKIAVGLPDSGSHRVVEELIRHFEVDVSRTEILPMRIAEARDLLAEGKIDGLLMVLSLKSDAVEQLVAGGGVRLLGIGGDIGPGSEIEGFRLNYPYVEPYLIPVHAYSMPHDGKPGVPSAPIPTLAIRTVLAARADLPDTAARRITRMLAENRSRLTVGDREVSMMGTMDDTANLQFPLHDGAAQYFARNEPGFLVRYAEVIGLLFSLGVAGYGLFRAGGKWLLQQRKDRIDEYYLELNRILDGMLKPQSKDELVDIQKRLQMIRSTALHQLAKERLQPDESFRIFQTVLAEAGAQVRHKLQILQGS
ncbi:C4-dicarboxylate ABC transporter substrate-binding protein [Haloferula helveola]|uniref:C4-dicarboxylate ABC transporter substrate-binding protein n=1 Tax=Haloferula helveola TaxID=490095 RepID=A0ABN6H714_9BACT|nr:C4-dicarboxylate ABC transporter substrate-binding protein [Haloferula helveola]